MRSWSVMPAFYQPPQPLLSSYDEAFIRVWAERLRDEEPNAVAVVLTGSYARDEAAANSDVDLQMVLRGEGEAHYRTLLVEHDGRLVHLSIGYRSLASWLALGDEPATWSFSLPTRGPARVLWAAADLAEQFSPVIERPAGDPELEDFIEGVAKVANAARAGDELALRLAAHDLVDECVSVVARLSSPHPVATRLEALRAALALPSVPEGYADDVLVCLGFTGRATSAEEVRASVMRLAEGVVQLLASAGRDALDEQSPEFPRYVADGSLLRYVRQLADLAPVRGGGSDDAAR
jgi:Nucleotidyltransferase domain